MTQSQKYQASANGSVPLRTSDPEGSQQGSMLPSSGTEAIEVVQDVIRKYPAVTLGIAVAAGLAIGWMVKRR